MRRRILRSILTVLTITTVVLGVPLIYTAWLWVEDITRNDLQSRLERISTEVIAQERVDGTVHDGLDIRAMSALVPEGGKLTIVYPTPDDNAARTDVGVGEVTDPLVESLSMGTSSRSEPEVPIDSDSTSGSVTSPTPTSVRAALSSGVG